MKQVLAAILLLCLLSQISLGQDIWKRKRYEAVAGLGTSQFFGDIGGFSQGENIIGLKDISFKQTRFNVNGGIRYRIMPVLSARLSLTYAMLHATDNRGSNESRGMEATTSVFEPLLLGEYYFIKSKAENSYLFTKGRKTRFNSILESLDLYLFTGFGGLSYSVKGNDKLISSGIVDKGFTAVIPVGVGGNLLVNPNYNFGVEIGGRYSFTDYLEGYTSQYSKSNDVYYFLTFTFTYKIPTSSKGVPLFLTKRRF